MKGEDRLAFASPTANTLRNRVPSRLARSGENSEMICANRYPIAGGCPGLVLDQHMIDPRRALLSPQAAQSAWRAGPASLSEQDRLICSPLQFFAAEVRRPAVAMCRMPRWRSRMVIARPLSISGPMRRSSASEQAPIAGFLPMNIVRPLPLPVDLRASVRISEIRSPHCVRPGKHQPLRAADLPASGFETHRCTR